MFGKMVGFTVKKDDLTAVLDAIIEYGTVKVNRHTNENLYLVSVRCPSDVCTSYVNNILELSRKGVQIWNLRIN